jgi:lipopolysaccharide export system permease protein
MILLEDGTLQQRQSENGPPSILSFERTLVQLGGQVGSGRTAHPRLQWLTLGELMRPPDEIDDATRARYRIETHWRLAQPLFALAYGVVALASLLVDGTGRRVRLWRGLLAVLTVCAMQGAAYAVLGMAIRLPQLWPLLYLVPLTPALLALGSLRMRRLGPMFLVRAGAIRP